MTLNDDTICAVATRPGGALGIVRVSGPEAIRLTDSIFRAASGHPLASAAPYTLSFGQIVDGTGAIIDEVLISVFRAPHSFTGQDSTEISCHGSAYILEQVCRLLLEAGCRQASPGEFTQRAFLNGKMDLSQAEAVADLIASGNRATHRIAMSQLKGHFSSELSVLRDQLLNLTSLLELELDFADHEELEFANRTELLSLAQRADDRITELARSFKTGQALKEGIPVAIVGKTNVGKSTLLNRLLKDDRAIVSDIHGTTRDTIEDTIQIKGVTFRFIDTAGIRQTADEIEQIGISRTFAAIDKALIVIWMLDSQPAADEIKEIASHLEGKKLILTLNKSDLNSYNAFDASALNLPADDIRSIEISAKFNKNITELENLIYELADIPEINADTVIVTQARHFEALNHAHLNLERVINGLNSTLSGDLIAEDLRLVLQDLAEITGGAITPDETLRNIFQHFCIGK
ncbi:MAG: tRNA uridine-5-carboxymethylaminomethyl(34) synthesis GTPase MnmE [Bacteroidaceae bacterium]|nr:tRNA uridine-5-carboxymethylaminomethyl(34) synthesis GTPase MnmE [Bacteroidaceae bacterium]